MADVTSSIAYLGNPVKLFVANNSRSWTYACNPWDLYVHGGKVWISSGCAGGAIDNNAGPVPLLSYDPSTSTIGGAGVGATTVATEKIEQWRDIDGVLTTTGVDPRSGDPLLIFRLVSGSWSTVTQSNTFVHCQDIAKFDGRYYVCGSPYNFTNGVYYATSVTSTSWAAVGGSGIGGAFSWIYGLEEFDGVLYAFEGFSPGGGFPGVNACASGTTFTAVTNSAYEDVFPSDSTSDGTRRVGRSVVFDGKFVYVSGKLNSGEGDWTPIRLYAATDLNPISTAAVTLPNTALPWDLKVIDSTLYLLGKHTSGSDTVVGVYSTTDLSSWTEEFTFKPINVTGSGYTAAQTLFGRSFEYLDGVWYFGMGSPYALTPQPASVGALLSYGSRKSLPPLFAHRPTHVWKHA